MFYEEPGITLYCGDSLTILPLLREHAGLTLTDPPYELEAHTLQRRVKRALNGRTVMTTEVLPFRVMDEETRTAASLEIGRLSSRWALIFCQVEGAPKWREYLETHGGMIYRRTCLWIKPDGMPQYSGDRPGMGYETILAMHARGASRWNGGGRHGVWTFNKNSGGAHEHPTMKPLLLINELVSLFSDPGELLLDPFAGSGPVLEAAKNLGRKAIGIEIDPEYCELAVRRLRQECLF